MSAPLRKLPTQEPASIEGSESMKARLEDRRESFSLQAHFLHPVFDLFKDLPSLSGHLFAALRHYNLSLSDIKFESAGGSLGEIYLRLSWPSLAETRLFLDRVEVSSDYLQFLRFQERDLVADVIGAVGTYVHDAGFLAYRVTQQIHGALPGETRSKLLSQFVSNVPEGLGPVLGSGVVFYFGAEAERLATSVTLDFSRVVDGGLFVQSVGLYDASKVELPELQKLSRQHFKSLLERVGLEE
jgi:hypothetical protein